MPPRHVLYLHGFRSSPASFKARRVQEALRLRDGTLEFWCPQLPASPAAAIALALAGLAAWPVDATAIIGSSLGGFYATVLAERLGCRAVLLNPAVAPERDLARMIGEQTTWQDPQQRFHFQAAFIDELRDMKPERLSLPARYACVIADGDEVLDPQEMKERYRAAHLRVLPQGDHALSDFDEPLRFLLEFLEL